MNRNRNRIVWVVFLMVALEAIVTTPALNVELAMGHPSRKGWFFALLVSALVLPFAWLARNLIARCASSLARKLTTISDTVWLLICFVTGSILRLAWVAAFPIHQRSDYATYVQLAESLAKFHSYGSPGSGMAFWPPGYPLFLSLNFLLLGIHTWVPVVINLFLFLLALFAVQKLAARAADQQVSRFATLLLTCWPTYFMCAGLASKEMLVLTLLPLAVLAFFQSADAESRSARLGWLVLAGILLGCASLTQPSLMLFPTVLFAYEWLRKENLALALARVACVGCLMALTILPWTLRNHRVFQAWVPISTNGGDVFYRANNDSATGGFTENTDQTFQQLDEVSRSKVGYAMGKRWIRQNPGRFLSLALRKQVLFLGDDSTGAYESMKRGSTTSGIKYAGWKGICNLYWMALWILVLAGLMYFWKRYLAVKPEIAALMLSVLYLYSMHSVFESGGKYHIPLVAFFAVLAALPAAQVETDGTRAR